MYFLVTLWSISRFLGEFTTSHLVWLISWKSYSEVHFLTKIRIHFLLVCPACKTFILFTQIRTFYLTQAGL